MIIREHSTLNTAGACILLALTLAACQTSLGGAGRGGAAPQAGPANRGGPARLDGSNAAIVDWSQAAYDAFVAEEKYANPLRAARVLAMVHIAQHDALAAIRPAYAAHTFVGAVPDADPVVAASSAAYDVLAAELPGQRTQLAARLARTVESAPDRAAAEKGVTLGQRAAGAIRERRRTDGADTPAMVRQKWQDRPGAFKPVAPWDIIFAPGWQRLQPFALQTAAQFRVAAPPALESAEYATAFNEVKRLGGKASAARSADQAAYAAFWYEFSDIGWNRIARVVAGERQLGLQATARLFAMLNMAISDAYVAGWDSKLHHNFWRPATAIQKADGDGNPATAPDAGWESAHVTPPIQDHPSTHSALGDAAAEVLAHVFGDATSFSFTSTTGVPATVTRRFATFTEAANENADSRVMAGLHFRFACRAGQALGRQIGAWVTSTALQPTTAIAAK
jgi:hypothetical protein